MGQRVLRKRQVAPAEDAGAPLGRYGFSGWVHGTKPRARISRTICEAHSGNSTPPGSALAGWRQQPAACRAVARTSFGRPFLASCSEASGFPTSIPRRSLSSGCRNTAHLKTVKDEVTKAGKVWEAELNNLYVSGHIARGVLACDPKFAANEIEARKTIREQFPKRDTDITTADFLRVAKQALRLGGTGTDECPCTVLILDEAQQYIGDSNDRSVLFTEVAEAVSKELESQVILVAAGQSALTGVPLLQKLMDRFTIAYRCPTRTSRR